MLLEMTWIQTGTIIWLIAMLGGVFFAGACYVMGMLRYGRGVLGPGHGVPPPISPPTDSQGRDL